MVINIEQQFSELVENQTGLVVVVVDGDSSTKYVFLVLFHNGRSRSFGESSMVINIGQQFSELLENQTGLVVVVVDADNSTIQLTAGQYTKAGQSCSC